MLLTKMSQHKIEDYLEGRFQDPGTFLEIGAWDGALISQTIWLEKEHGWQGLCVDPFPRDFSLRSAKLAEVAISRDGKPREFVKVSIDRRDGGDVSYFSGFKDTIQTHWKLISEFCDYEIVEIPTMTIQELYRKYDLPNYIEFLSVDTEGSELEIFRSIDFSVYSYGMIVFEHNESSIIKHGVGEILVTNGYHLLDSLRCDDIYMRPKNE